MMVVRRGSTVSEKTMGNVPLIEIWLPALMLPLRRSKPSLVLAAVSASFLVAFTITFSFVGIIQQHRPLSTHTLPALSVIYDA